MKGLASLMLVVAVFLSACSTVGGQTVNVAPSAEQEANGKIPPGVPFKFIPSPGKCRVWYPDRPADQQSPSEKCLEITGDVPPGAWLVYGGPKIKTYRIEEYDPQRPGVVIWIRYYELESGRFLRQDKICE